MLGVKFKWNVSGVTGEAVVRGNAATAATWESRYTAKTVRWTHGRTWGCGCDENVEDVPDEMMPAKKFTLKEFLEIFHDNESIKY